MRDDKRRPTALRTIRSVEHAVAILRHISKARLPLGISQIARLVELDKSSVSRLIATLERQGLVEKAGGSTSVRLGYGLVALAAPLLSDMRLSTLVRPRLEQLSQRLGETINLSIWDGREAVSIVQALGTNAITHYAVPGQRNPAHCTASGKVLLAHAPEADIETILGETLETYTDKTIVSVEQLRTQLQEIRAVGYALNHGEFASDVAGVSVVLRGADESVIGAITATVPMYRFDDQRETEILHAIAAMTSELSEAFNKGIPISSDR